MLNLLEAVVGEQFVSREPFHSMGSKESLARYQDKLVNISRENGVAPMRNEDGFNSLVSCEGITGRDVYSKAVSYVPTTKFIFASNHDLCFQHPDDAVWDRLIVILFTKEVTNRDLNLEEKLFEERDIIVSLALDTLKDLVDSGYNFKESEASRRSGPQIRDFFHPNATARYPNDRDPDAPNPYARNRFFEAERKRFMVNANNQFGNLQPKENPAAIDCQLTEPIIPTLTFNLGSTFKGSPEQLAEAQAQLEQQLNRTGTFALEFQQMAQSNGLAVNMQFNIHNTYDLAGDSADGTSVVKFQSARMQS